MLIEHIQQLVSILDLWPRHMSLSPNSSKAMQKLNFDCAPGIALSLKEERDGLTVGIDSAIAV